MYLKRYIIFIYTPKERIMKISQTQYYLLINNVIAGQTPTAVEQFSKVLSEFNTIIEIGTGRGAFSYWIRNTMDKDTRFITYDITGDRYEFKNSDIDFRVGDCFSENVMNEIKQEIEIPNRKVLLLCDGGYKEREFEIFSPSLKSGDVIMCHDYAETVTEFSKLMKTLNWPTKSESHYQKLPLVGLQKWKFYNEFKNVLWGAFVKA
jgi:hypothetical protein